MSMKEEEIYNNQLMQHRLSYSEHNPFFLATHDTFSIHSTSTMTFPFYTIVGLSTSLLINKGQINIRSSIFYLSVCRYQ